MSAQKHPTRIGTRSITLTPWQRIKWKLRNLKATLWQSITWMPPKTYVQEFPIEYGEPGYEEAMYEIAYAYGRGSMVRLEKL